MKNGLFQLRTPGDLFEKLEWELEELRKDPSNPWIAFNLFVTAEHLPDWVDNKSIKYKEALLRVCGHLANGGKHFNPTEHHAVAEAEHDGVFEEDVFEKGVFEERLKITLEDEEAERLGFKDIDAVSLAEKVVDWWAEYLGRSRSK